MNQDNISVIIVNYNGKKWLGKCLDSLVTQSYKYYDITVVDNNSSDGSTEFVKKTYPQVRLIVNDGNYGFARGNNSGIVAANGKLILLLNSDAWLDPDFLGKSIRSFYINNCDVLAPQENDYENLYHETYSTTIDIFGHPVFDYSDKVKDFYLQGVCLLFRKDLYEQTLGLDEDFFMYFEETDWMWRLRLLNKKLYRDKSIFVHHAGAGSTTEGLNYKRFLWRNQNTLQMLLKNYAWFNLIWVIPLYLVQNICEMLVFLFFLKPKIAMSYGLGWWYNIINIKKIMVKRRWVQRHRVVVDREIVSLMYFGIGKLKHLKNYAGKSLHS